MNKITTQISDRNWVLKALTFWESAKPNKIANAKIIKWNIEVLTEALKRLDS
jgi:hypothetical protein